MSKETMGVRLMTLGELIDKLPELQRIAEGMILRRVEITAGVNRLVDLQVYGVAKSPQSTAATPSTLRKN